MLPHRLLVSNPLLVRGSRLRVRGRRPSPHRLGQTSFVGGKIPRGANSVATAPSAPRSGAHMAQPRKGGPARRPNIPLVNRSRHEMFRMNPLARTTGRPPPPALRSGGGTPAGRKPDSAFLADPSLPRLGAYSVACVTYAARAGPERHCRERRGPSAGDGLGNRGAIRGLPVCRDREHGGTQAVSRRLGSPREARSEGPKVLP